MIEAFILGMVQGLTEFLPVSSSGHLLILQRAFGLHAEGGGMLLLNILLHVGTLVAVLVVYRARILHMLRHPVQSELKWLVVATIPAVIAALTINFDEAFEGKFIVWSFYLTSLVLVVSGFIAEQRRRQKKQHKEVRWQDAAAMGVMQAVAILPGLSRSGSTIAGGLASGLTRKRAADFSFLMSIPAILGSVVFELKGILEMGAAGSAASPGAIIVGILSAMVFGFLAIKLMLWIVRRISLNWFALYTFLLGTYLLIDKYILHGFMA
ncbi:MAG: undecaprenyl-diphosphate phosphatase [Christensenellales bacterium]|jgi:undecaprenyl-diphosphatase